MTTFVRVAWVTNFLTDEQIYLTVEMTFVHDIDANLFSPLFDIVAMTDIGNMNRCFDPTLN